MPTKFMLRLLAVFTTNLLGYGLFVVLCLKVITMAGIRTINLLALMNILALVFVSCSPKPEQTNELICGGFGLGLLFCAIGTEVAGSLAMSAAYQFGISDLKIFGDIFTPIMFAVTMFLLWRAQKHYTWR